METKKKKGICNLILGLKGITDRDCTVITLPCDNLGTRQLFSILKLYKSVTKAPRIEDLVSKETVCCVGGKVKH